MSSAEIEEQENFKRLKKLIFQVGLPLVRELFVTRYNQSYGSWKETPEFGEKLLKMLDDQHNSKETEMLNKHKERQNIQSGKSSKWDYTVLQIILTRVQFDLDLGDSSTPNAITARINRIETENQMVHILTHVRNKLAHDYWEEEKIPNEEFNRLWKKAYNACSGLGAEKSVMEDIYPSYQHQNHNHNASSGRERNSRRDRSSEGQRQGQRSSSRGSRGKSGNRTFVNSSSSSSPQPQQEKNTTTTTNGAVYSSKAASTRIYTEEPSVKYSKSSTSSTRGVYEPSTEKLPESTWASAACAFCCGLCV